MNKKNNNSIFQQLFNWYEKDFDWLADIEVTIATVIVAIVIIIGPLILVLFLAKHNYLCYAIVLGLLWVFFIIQAIKDYQQKKFSLICKIFFIAWLILIGVGVVVFIVAEFL